jgi:uncharacterized protein involved in response to NO
MLFGYVGAVIAGFLLTAVPNWTGRLPIQGLPLALLFSTWLAGRLAVDLSGAIRWGGTMAADSLFLLLLVVAAAREIVAGRKWSNLKVVGIILLALVNIAFHVEAHVEGLAQYSARAGIALVITPVGVIGGRIVPGFTRNWFARQPQGRMPIAGRPLAASLATQVLYLAVVSAALARVCAALEPSHADVLFSIAGAAWIIAFLGFTLIYGSLLCTARKA